MRNIDCTTVSWVQEKSERATRENRAERYSAKVSRRKENMNELISGLVMFGFFVTLIGLGFIF